MERESLWECGDRVRFERFGEWLSGVVVQVENGLICIQYTEHGSTTWRRANSPNVERDEAQKMERLADFLERWGVQA